MDIRTLLEELVEGGTFERIARNRLAQFGTRSRRLIGAELLPSQDVDANAYTDDTVRYRTVVGNAGTRYSPVQIKGGALTGSVKVELFNTDIGSELSARDYDALLRYLARQDTMAATAQVTSFVDTTVNQALEELREVYRWQAIEKAEVNLRGDNGYVEDIPYSNPANHRAGAADDWTDDTYDPFDDIFDRVQLLADKGFVVSRIFASRRVLSIMGANAKVRGRSGTVVVNAANGDFIAAGGRASLSQINAALAAEGLPPIELIDLQYRTMTGTQRFISDNVMIFVAQTGRDVELDLGDEEALEPLQNTLGYTAVGRAVGQADQGRVILVRQFEDKPPRLEAQGWETIAPVILEPEAIATIEDIGD